MLRYGVGVSYNVSWLEKVRIKPVVEFVGWTVLNGFQTFFGPVTPPRPDLPNTHGVESARTTIINAKIGVRTYFGCHHDIYFGWGHALTSDRWYRDIARVEYRFCF